MRARFRQPPLTHRPEHIFSILPKGEGFSPQRFGAVALCVRDFARHSRYPVAVLSGIDAPGFEGVRSIIVARARWWEGRTRGYARGCIRAIRQERPALAEIHNRPRLLWMIAPHVSCKLALHLHNDPQEMDGSRTPRERRTLLARCDGIYCVSHYIRDRFAQGLEGGPLEKLHVIHNGLELPSAPALKEKLVVFAGRMTEGKGALLLAQALCRALPSMQDWRAVLIGSRRHARAHALTPHEREIAQTLAPVSPQVEQPGFLSHPETLRFFARAHIAVVPSVWQEPFGRTAIEAMSQGCALISSGRGGLREVTADAALTVDDLTPQALADALMLLARDEKERDRLQHLALRRVQAFAIVPCTQALDAARERILKGHGF